MSAVFVFNETTIVLLLIWSIMLFLIFKGAKDTEYKIHSPQLLAFYFALKPLGKS